MRLALLDLFSARQNGVVVDNSADGRHGVTPSVDVELRIIYDEIASLPAADSGHID